ncbi:hypothetical protein CSB09_00025 [Candidatus Gracilibacteria bacterium]|nr:MAG: hypothetical protein CSB09_00025 [Candidatus Gracilibacteria bacterium]
MKKILLLLLSLSPPFLVHALMSSTLDDFTLGRIDIIERNDTGTEVSITFDNFVYYKIKNKLRVLRERNTFRDERVTIRDVPKTLSLKKGDIVAHASVWSGTSPGILKITCQDGVMKIEGTQSVHFGTKSLNRSGSYEGNDTKLLKKINEVIGCDRLFTFFESDRRFEDLYGTNLKIYVYIALLFSVIMLGGGVFFVFKRR